MKSHQLIPCLRSNSLLDNCCCCSRPVLLARGGESGMARALSWEVVSGVMFVSEGSKSAEVIDELAR